LISVVDFAFVSQVLLKPQNRKRRCCNNAYIKL
jgi:hypothetical protein